MNNQSRVSSQDNELDDKELLERLRQKDEAAFETLVRRFQKKAFAVAYGHVGDHSEAMEVVHEAFIKVFRSIDRFRGDSSLYTWLYRIVVNVSLDHLRGRKNLPTDSLTHTDDEGEDSGEERHESDTIHHPDRILESAELRAEMQRALDQLSPDHRAVIILREVEGLSYSDIAETMGCTTGTVMSRLFYARKKLQEMLKGHR
ncbi:MAG: sigma-70 family RNA polymerase sigma factor [Nitrospirota bacterium]|nr:sigma-70 family RNA polymerase sigma factor [Nitrospirota bacterium]